MSMSRSSSATASASASFSSLQSSARKTFPTLPLPSLKYGLDISTQPDSIDFSAISSVASKDVIFPVNETLENGVFVCDLSVLRERFPLLEKKIGSLLSLQNYFESFHLSNVKNILAIVVPEHVHVANPVAIAPGLSVFEHVVVFAQKNSSISLVHVEKDIQKEHHPFHSTAVEIFAEENARVSYTSIQALSPTRQRIAFKRARVEKNASVDWHWAEFGSQFVKLDVSSILNGEHASTKNYGVYLGNHSQILDVDASVHHLAPNTKSELLARGVLDDSSKNVYKGLIKMTHVASGSVGTQRADVLVLSPLAEADPVPMLEIEGSDIRCSHAATVSRLDENKLFYLVSRGLDEKTARSLYITGFLDHLLARFPSLSIVSESRSHITTKLGLSSLEEESFLHSPAEVLA